MRILSGRSCINAYSEVTRLIERLHRRYLDVIRFELSKLGVEEVNAVQALLLMNVQHSEMTIRELVERGYHVGSNVTYNVRQLVDAGYVEQHRSERDRRSVKLNLTQKGLDLCSRLSEMESRHGESLLKIDGGNESDKGRDLLRALERVWSDYIQYGAP